MKGNWQFIWRKGDWGAWIAVELAESVKKPRKRWICNFIYAYYEPALNSLVPPVRDYLPCSEQPLPSKILTDCDSLFNLQWKLRSASGTVKRELGVTPKFSETKPLRWTKRLYLLYPKPCRGLSTVNNSYRYNYITPTRQRVWMMLRLSKRKKHST